MATFETGSNLVVSEIQDKSDLADSTISLAKTYLADLAAAGGSDLNLTVVDVNIANAGDLTWSDPDTLPTAPVEPDYAADVVDPGGPDIGDVTIPTAVGSVDDMPDWEDPAATPPDAMPEVPGSLAMTAPTDLDELPDITAVAPIIDVGVLDDEFAFSEPVYVERVSGAVQANIEYVLSGNLGLPDAYWTSLWESAANDLARQQVGRQRNARNRGAASYWPLPSETVLAEQRRIDDEGVRSVQLDRLEKAKAQAVFAREDFWQAISQGIAYENQWIAAHEQMAARALSAAEQLHGLKVQVHNANVARYNAALEAAKLDGTIEDMQVKRTLSKHQALLSQNGVEIEQDKQRVARYQAQYQGYGLERDAYTSKIAAQVQMFNSQVDGAAKFEALKQEKNKLDLDKYGKQLAEIEAVASATASVLQARTGAQEFDLRKLMSDFSISESKNKLNLEVSRINQAAQEAAARIDVAQAQWAGGQGVAVKQSVAELAFGYAQAALAASDVSLGASYGISLSGDA